MNIADYKQDLVEKLQVISMGLRDPDLDWYTRLFILLLVAYLLSPVDLIPDFIPVLGYLDEIMLLPVAWWLISRLIPTETMKRYRRQAVPLPSHYLGILGLFLVLSIWMIVLAGLFLVFFPAA